MQTFHHIYRLCRGIYIGDRCGLAEVPEQGSIVEIDLSDLLESDASDMFVLDTQSYMADLWVAYHMVLKTNPTTPIIIIGDGYADAVGLLLLLHSQQMNVVDAIPFLQRCSRMRVDHEGLPVPAWPATRTKPNLKFVLNSKLPFKDPSDRWPHRVAMRVWNQKPGSIQSVSKKRPRDEPVTEHIHGDIHQFKFKYKPSAWACGPIAIMASIMSEWIDMKSWRSKIVDSIIINGLWHARRYENAFEGQCDVVKHLEHLCPDIRYRPVDFTDHMDGRVGWKDKLRPILEANEVTRLLLTFTMPSAPVGHHNFIGYDGAGSWYWLEPMNLDGQGSTLSVFCNFEDFVNHAENRLCGRHWCLVLLRKSRWSTVPQQSLAPRTFYHCRIDSITVEFPAHLRVNHQGFWEALIDGVSVSLNPIRMTSQPHFTICTNIKLLPGSIIHLDCAPKSDGTQHSCRVLSKHVDQSPFDDPAIWITPQPQSHLMLVGRQGRSIVYYMRRCKYPNTAWTTDRDGQAAIVVLQAIEPGGEIYRPE